MISYVLFSLYLLVVAREATELSNVEMIVSLLSDGMKQQNAKDKQFVQFIENYNNQIDGNYRRALLNKDPASDRFWILMGNRFLNKPIPAKFAYKVNDDEALFGLAKEQTTKLWKYLPDQIKNKITNIINAHINREISDSKKISNAEHVVNLLFSGLKRAKGEKVGKAIKLFEEEIKKNYETALKVTDSKSDRFWILLGNRFLSKPIPEKFAKNTQDNLLNFNLIKDRTFHLWTFLPNDIKNEIEERVFAQINLESPKQKPMIFD